MNKAEAPPSRDRRGRSALPKERPPSWPLEGAATFNGDEARFDWAVLVPLYIHPAKVAIIEALRWIQEPLSANELSQLLGLSNYRLGTLAYHLNDLAERGVIEQVYERQVRGARETYFFFPDP